MAESSWKKDGDWKKRYSKLYSSQRTSIGRDEEPSRISFMSTESTPTKSLMFRIDSQKNSNDVDQLSLNYLQSLMSQKSDIFNSRRDSMILDDRSGRDTKLLDIVRAHNKEDDSSKDDVLSKPLEIPQEDAGSDADDQASDAYVRVMSMRATDRSVSRSRVSRISPRRDMDIPSILAFSAPYTNPAPTTLEIPAFQNISQPSTEPEIPRWSIRRSVCPVCSQKWKDKSAIVNIKYSGLKKNSSLELPSVMAPARLRTKITMAYEPRPVLPVVDENLPGYGSMRNTSASWQLKRARRFKAPKQQPPPPEAIAPPTMTAPIAQKDLDIRVNKFLNDEP